MKCRDLIFTLTYLSFVACTDHKKEGISAFDSGNYDQAIYHFEKVVRLYPEDHVTLHNLARSYEVTGDIEQAIEYYSKSIKQTIDPYEYNSYVGRGRCLWAREEYDLAVIDFNNALSANPRNFESRYYRARYHIKNNRFRKAYEDINIALEVDPENPQALYHKGLIYGQWGNIPLAIRSFSKAVQGKPDFAAAYFGRGVMYQSLDRYSRALQDYDMAFTLGLNSDELLYRQGACYFQTGQPDKGCKNLRQMSSKKDPEGFRNAYCM